MELVIVQYTIEHTFRFIINTEIKLIINNCFFLCKWGKRASMSPDGK